MRRKQDRRNSEEATLEMSEINERHGLFNRFANMQKAVAKDKNAPLNNVVDEQNKMMDSGRPMPFDDAPDEKMKPKAEDAKVSNAMQALKDNPQSTKDMFQRVYSIPSEDKMKRSKKAKLTGQVPRSVNVFGSHYPVARLIDDNTLVLNTSNYGQDGKTQELVQKIKNEIPEKFPDHKVIHVNHPDYRHAAKIMRMRNKNALHDFLHEASSQHPDEEYRQHALDSLSYLKSLKKGEFSKPIHAKRTEAEGWDGQENIEMRTGRITQYLEGLGLNPDAGKGKKRDLGSESPTSVNINAKGDPIDQQMLHEGAHAMLTPDSMTLQDYQSGIGQPGYKGKLHQSKYRKELKESHGGGMPEQSAQQMEGMIARRSGVEPFRSPQRGTKANTEVEQSRAHAKKQMQMFDEGITRFDPFTGENEIQGNINSYINSKMMGDPALSGKVKQKLHSYLKMKNEMKQSGQYDDDDILAASEDFFNDMEKGEIGRAAKNMMLAGVMAGAASGYQKEAPQQAPQAQERSVKGTNLDPNIRQRPAYLEAQKDTQQRKPAGVDVGVNSAPTRESRIKDFTLQAISDVESSGGKNTNHAQLPQNSIHRGERAFGSYGLTPLLIRETIKKHPDLMEKYGHMTKQKGELFRESLGGIENPQDFEKDIASRHYDRVAKQFGHNPAMIGMAWLNGINGTKRAVKQGRDINNHWHVKKIMNAYNKRFNKDD